MRRRLISAPLCLAAAALALTGGALKGVAQGNTSPHPAAQAVPLLPSDFAGWSLTGSLLQSASPSAADSSNEDVLTEDGFAQFAAGDYTGDGGKLSLRAMRFEDASGAYAAYTFYRRPGMLQEDVGLGAANDGKHLLFWQGVTVVDATFDHVSAMSAAQLRELAQLLPTAGGSAGVPPTLPRYLPVQRIAPTTIEPLATRYTLGPAGYTRTGGVLPPSMIGFDHGAEVLSSAYLSHAAEGTLTLINYPTPQLAAERQRGIEAFLKAGNSPQAAWPQALAASSPQSIIVRRSGPLLAITSGSLPEVEARKLINQVNYLAEVTWNDPKGYNSEVSKTAHILLSIAALSAMLCGAALIIGVFLGGGRALLRKMQGKPVSTLQDSEFISLRLDK